VSDNAGGTADRQLCKRLLHKPFGLSIQGARGFIEQEDGGSLENDPSRARPLTLSTGEPTPFRPRGVEPVRQSIQELRRRRGFGGGQDFASVASGLPYRIFSQTFAPKIIGSCGTRPIRRRNAAGSVLLMSTPSSLMHRPLGS